MTDISIDDMINARQQAQPGFKKAITPEQAQRNQNAAKDAIGQTGYKPASNTGPAANDFYNKGKYRDPSNPGEYNFMPDPDSKTQSTSGDEPATKQQSDDTSDDSKKAGKKAAKKTKRPTGQAAIDKFQQRHMFKSDEEGKEETPSEGDITKDEVDRAYPEEEAEVTEEVDEEPSEEFEIVEETPSADEEKLRAILGDDIYQIYVTDPSLLGSLFNTVQNVAENVPLFRSVPDIDGQIDARMAARVANEPFQKSPVVNIKTKRASDAMQGVDYKGVDRITREITPDEYAGGIIDAAMTAMETGKDGKVDWDKLRGAMIDKRLLGPDTGRASLEFYPNLDKEHFTINVLKDPKKGASYDNVFQRRLTWDEAKALRDHFIKQTQPRMADETLPGMFSQTPETAARQRALYDSKSGKGDEEGEGEGKPTKKTTTTAKKTTGGAKSFKIKNTPKKTEEAPKGDASAEESKE